MKLTLLLGPVGAGKTTFGLTLAQKQTAIFFNLDEWMTTLFRPDRPQDNIMEWYANRVNRCKQQILTMTEKSLSNHINVILEIGLLQRIERESFFNWCDERNIELTIYVFDVERSIRRERVKKRNSEKGSSFSMEVPMEFFELASDFWQDIDTLELEGRNHIIL
ncbi:MAG: ATP-binding protein [Pseudobdellovibrio sp.]